MSVKPGTPSLGRVLAVLRTTLDLSQSDLARLAKVKRASISEYERDVTMPDASTLKRLLSAMRFRWSAVDLGSWFIERLHADCRNAEGQAVEPARGTLLATTAAEAARLSADAAEVSKAAAKLNDLVRTLQARGEEGMPPQSTLEGTGVPHPSLEDRSVARAHWARMISLERKEQEEVVRDVPAEVQWAVCELLCLESQRVCADDPTRAGELAELALLAAQRAAGDVAWIAKLRGLASAHLGNAVRAKGDLQTAERAFASAERLWEAGQKAPQGLLEEGLFFALKASLRRAQRRFQEAAELLDRALSVTRNPKFRVQVLVSRARLFCELGELDEAVVILANLNEAVAPDEEGRVLFWIRYNLCDIFSKLGRQEEAAVLLPEARTLCVKYGGELNLVRVLWTEGRIAVGLGDLDHGVAILNRVRGEFASRGMGYDTALVSLELADLYAGQGRVQEVKTLARHMVPIFQAQDVHREALAALTLFRQAAEREEVTSELTREILSYLRRARCNPELRFERRMT